MESHGTLKSDRSLTPRVLEPSYPYFSSAVSRRTEEIVLELQQDVKKIDEGFEVSWDHELSLIRATKAVKQAVEKILIEKNALADPSEEIKRVNEAHNQLKAYENILMEKEKLVLIRETELKNERIRLDLYRKDLADERLRINQDKAHIQLSFEKVIEEKDKVAIQMKKLNEKYSEIKQTLNDFEEKKTETSFKVDLGSIENPSEKDLIEKYKELESQRLQFENEKELQLKKYLKIEENLKERDRNLETKKESLQELANSMQTLKQELNKHQQKISSEMDSQFYEVKEQEKELNLKKKELDDKIVKLNQELAQVELLKNSFETQNKKLLLEESKLKASYSKKLEDNIIGNEEIQEKIETLVEKEKYLEDMINALKDQEKDLEERWKYLSSMENLKEELERVQMLYQDMDSDYENREIILQSKIKLLDLREQKILALETNDKDELFKINALINTQLQKLQEEDEKVSKAQEFILKEKEELDKSAVMLQNIFTELSVQRKTFLEDQLKLEMEKSNFIEVVGKLEEESKIISENEDLINTKLLELKEKELILEEKEYELLIKEQELLKNG